MTTLQVARNLQAIAKKAHEEGSGCIRWMEYWERQGDDEQVGFWREQALGCQRKAQMLYALARHHAGVRE